MHTRTLTVLDINQNLQSVSLTYEDGDDISVLSETYMLSLANAQFDGPCIAVEMRDA